MNPNLQFAETASIECSFQATGYLLRLVKSVHVAGIEVGPIMTLQHREALIERLEAERPSLLGFVKNCPAGMGDSWDSVSFGFQRGFDEMWDLAWAGNGLLDRPLLTLWRQSVELSLKSAIYYIEGTAEKKIGHNLSDLFDKVLKISTEAGLDQDNDLEKDVKAMIKHVQSFDLFATRFRYPADKKGNPYKGVDVNLEKLFQAHWIIVTWCEGTVVELGEKFGIGAP